MYEVIWEDEEGVHETPAAIRGPVETKINFIQKHGISVDRPNFSLNILMPKTESSLEYFRRYSKFYLKGVDKGSMPVCWRVEAIDWISMPGILELNAVEYYMNETEDDIENGIVKGLLEETPNPNTKELEEKIVGPVFIKPKLTYEYSAEVLGGGSWYIDKEYPVKYKVDENDSKKIQLYWDSGYSGQFEISFNNLTKTIVVESLF